MMIVLRNGSYKGRIGDKEDRSAHGAGGTCLLRRLQHRRDGQVERQRV